MVAVKGKSKKPLLSHYNKAVDAETSAAFVYNIPYK